MRLNKRYLLSLWPREDPRARTLRNDSGLDHVGDGDQDARQGVCEYEPYLALMTHHVIYSPVGVDCLDSFHAFSNNPNTILNIKAKEAFAFTRYTRPTEWTM